MSGFFIFIGILALIGYADQFLNTQTHTKTTPTKSDKPKGSTPIKTYDYEEKNNETKNQPHTNNVYIQNNVYVNVHQPKSSTKHTDHTEKVWNQLGYVVKEGETYAYKHYGNAIYTPDQVVSKKSISYKKPLQIGYGLSANQEKVKTLGYALVEKCGSKRAAKDILVEQYGFDEETARYAAGYRGYNDW